MPSVSVEGEKEKQTAKKGAKKEAGKKARKDEEIQELKRFLSARPSQQ